ncbi:MAG TPA: tRNA preQ1(34) S-adenosylmethionine ribosyltransferase-isomerase QueA [Burkholderiales bacterium]|nr:tRNA preQ1(34) S-adenosylmethionine ribosyltransferase-isomerase QueA [Burkholderiales bacterium]
MPDTGRYNGEMRLEDFDFDLPAELIAQFPAPRRADSRLLMLDGEGRLGDRRFVDLPQLVSPPDLLVFNDTRVMRARLEGHKQTGGKVEVLVERVVSERDALGFIRASHPPHPGALIMIEGAEPIRVVERREDLYALQFPAACSVIEFLERYGQIPLPPYINREAREEDECRYQTVYARKLGAVAAPTAGLHFDEVMLQRLSAQGIARAFLTLHVGAGTFQPVRSANVEAHRMHEERYSIPQDTCDAIGRARASGGRVIAVGTTTLRALESAAHDGCVTPGDGNTGLFIRPGYRFQVVDALITNFHLPRSTLLMLVAAFAGLSPILAAYRHAVRERYRFFSYGDAMFIVRRADPAT